MPTARSRRKLPRVRPRGSRQRVPGVSNWRRRCIAPAGASCSFGKSRSLPRCEPTKYERCYDRTQQYSITALTDAAGQVVERYAYSAYGEPTILDASLNVLPDSAVGNRYLYTGREWDRELGLYHYRARMYSPVSGRFVSRDPIGYIAGLDVYAYVLNRPTVYMDPSGTDLLAEMGVDFSYGGGAYSGPGSSAQVTVKEYAEACECPKDGFRHVRELGLDGDIGIGAGFHSTVLGFKLFSLEAKVITIPIQAKQTCKSECGESLLGCCQVCFGFGLDLPLGPGSEGVAALAGISISYTTKATISGKVCYNDGNCSDPGWHGYVCTEAELSIGASIGPIYAKGGYKAGGCKKLY